MRVGLLYIIALSLTSHLGDASSPETGLYFSTYWRY